MRGSVLEQFEADTPLTEELGYAREWDDVIPDRVINRILHGEHPVRVFREYRRMTPRQLAEKAGTNRLYIMQIESGKLAATPHILRRLAKALRVSLHEIA